MSNILVVIPTYNRAEFLGKAIDSALNQTIKPDILVIDDGSTDETLKVLEKYKDQVHIASINENMGAVYTNDIGCDFAVWNNYEFWIRLGSDDIFNRDKIKVDMEFMQKHPEYGCCYGQSVFLRKNGDKWEGTNEYCGNEYPWQYHRDHYRNKATLGVSFGWMNVCLRVEVLRKIKEKFGEYVDKRLRNMEDTLMNYYITRVTKVGWRKGGMAFWRINPVGCSGNHELTYKELVLSREIINQLESEREKLVEI